MRRTPLVIVTFAIAAGVLSGCSSAPDASALTSWISTARDAASSAAGALGGLAAAPGAGKTQTLSLSDATPVASVWLACTGTASATFDLDFVSGGTRQHVTQDIVCHSTPNTPIGLPAGMTTLTSLEVAVTSSDGQGAWVAVVRSR